LSSVSIDKTESDKLFKEVLSDDENYYKLNQEFKSPIRPLLMRRDVSGIPGYYVPTRLM
jgi:hypothetical protein